MRFAVGDLVCEVDERRPPRGEVVFSVSERHGIIPQAELFTKEIATTDRSKYRRIEYGDVVYNPYLLWNRAVGVCFDRRGGCVSPAYVVLRPREPATGRFLHYFFRSDSFVSAVDAIASGSVTRRRTAPVSEVLGLAFELPDQAYRKAASTVLDALDDKIELNRQMNETLEAMARALFKSWFVDFDPVRAKAAGRPTGLPPHLDALFPGSFEDSELGEIPKGWRVERWGELVSLEYGRALEGYGGGAAGYPVYGTNGMIGRCSSPLCEHPGIIIGRKGAYRGVHFSCEPFFVIDTAFYVEPKRSTELRWAYYQFLRHDINAMDSGSAIPSTSREDVYGMPVVAPPFGAQEAFARYMEPAWARQRQGDEASRTLAALRDALLPKLISGELRVTETGQEVPLHA